MRFPPDRNPDHLFPEFGHKVRRILKAMKAWCKVHAPDIKPVFGEGFRTRDRQHELFAQGRTKPGQIVTQKDGTHNPSRHQSALAFDLWFEKAGRLIFEGIPDAAWDYYGHLCRSERLEWGGSWKALQDKPHTEWPAQDRATYKAAKEWTKQHKLE